jgi:phospholipid/cholesterol/gamma-HCH transport system substrate-binding protein
VLASLALLLIIVVFVSGRENVFEARYQIIGLFKSAGGLQTGADVRLAGISVGYVTDIEFGPQKKVKVKMNISRRVQQRIRTDSVASIRTMGLMGDRYVEITLGSPNLPTIPNGDDIKTSEPFELSDLAQSAKPVVTDLAKTTHNILVLTDKLLARSSELETFLDNITDLSDSLQQGKGTLGALIKSDALLNEARMSLRHFDEFSAKADRVASEALKIAAAGQTVMQELKIIASNLKQVSEDMKKASPRLDPLLESAQSGISEARELMRTAEHSWLLGGSPVREHKENPIAVEGRDMTEPQEIK